VRGEDYDVELPDGFDDDDCCGCPDVCPGADCADCDDWG
jgi:hypothetical protein